MPDTVIQSPPISSTTRLTDTITMLNVLLEHNESRLRGRTLDRYRRINSENLNKLILVPVYHVPNEQVAVDDDDDDAPRSRRAVKRMVSCAGAFISEPDEQGVLITENAIIITHRDFRRLGLAKFAMEKLFEVCRERNVQYSAGVADDNLASTALMRSVGLAIASQERSTRSSGPFTLNTWGFGCSETEKRIREEEARERQRRRDAIQPELSREVLDYNFEDPFVEEDDVEI